MSDRRYRKSFSIFPRSCGQESVWFKHYYRVYYEYWSGWAEIGRYHIDNITSEEYLVRKLADNL